jgi:uncharacterized protein (TIGR04255 family)
MAEATLDSPFGSEPIEEIPLSSSPLIRALAQARYPRLVAMSKSNIDSTVARVVELLGAEYPIRDEQREAQITLGPDGVTTTPGANIWQLRSPDEVWQVSIAESFVSLETKKYVSRSDFTEKLQKVLQAIGETVSPPFVERLGMRYTNRIEDPDLLLRLQDLVRPEVLGGFAVPRPDGVTLSHTMSESLYMVGVNNLHARWGLLPGGTTFETSLKPLRESSWFLDIDSFSQERTLFNSEVLSVQAAALASSAYRYFRWVVKPEFIEAFGGGS